MNQCKMIFCRRAEVISILAFLEVSMISGTTAAANNDDNICSLYLAPSTIPGAGYGIFTTEDVAEMAEFVSSVRLRGVAFENFHTRMILSPVLLLAYILKLFFNSFH